VIRNVIREFECIGFRDMNANQDGICIFSKLTENTQYYVIMMNLPDNFEGNVFQINNYLWDIKNQLPCDVTRRQRYLNIYVTGNPEQFKELCGMNSDTNWILDRSRGVIMVFENQDDDFAGAYRALDKALSTPIESPKVKMPICVTSIVVVNFIIFLLTDLILPQDQSNLMYAWGAMYWPSVLLGKEVWRLVTSMFLHADFEHIANNMLLLFFVGGYLEDYLGKSKFLAVYFLSGILASLTSMGYNLLVRSAPLCYGASGAVFGVAGAMFAICIKYRKQLNDINIRRVGFFLFLSIWGGFSAKNVDNWAHIGGLVFGMLLGFIFTFRKEFKGLKGNM